MKSVTKYAGMYSKMVSQMEKDFAHMTDEQIQEVREEIIGLSKEGTEDERTVAPIVTMKKKRKYLL